MFDWIVDIVTGAGLAGVAFLMFIENVFPPIPSELIMPLAGFSAARGDMSLVGVVLAGPPARWPARSCGTGSACGSAWPG